MNKKFLNYKFFSLNPSRGFIVLYAVLLSSIVLAIGMSIYNITLKDLLFSSSGRESQFAFYSADSGVECALYWDRKKAFATSTNSTNINIKCGGDDNIQKFESLPENGPFVTIFSINEPDNKICVDVTVIKTVTGASTIESRGHNPPCVNNPRSVERGLKINY